MNEREINEGSLSKLCNLNSTLTKNILNGVITPGISTLNEISSALNIPIELLIDEEDNSNISIVRNSCGTESEGKQMLSSSNLEFKSLAPNKPMRSMEPFMVTLKSNEYTKEEPSSHEGEEFLYIVSGEVELTLGDKCINLSCGDSLYYDSIMPHKYRAISDKADMLTVVYTPW